MFDMKAIVAIQAKGPRTWILTSEILHFEDATGVLCDVMVFSRLPGVWQGKGGYLYAVHCLARTMAGASNTVTLENINPNFKRVEYAVRGPLVTRAANIEKELLQGAKKPFDAVIKANIGDGQAMGQVPITFIREVLALVSYPALLDEPRFAADVKTRAREILAGCAGGSMGSYTDKTGMEPIRRHAADYIQRRDGGIQADWQDVFLTAGATGIIKTVLQLLVADVDGKKPGVMVPIPQYPLYSASLAEFNITQIDYYLDEDNNWALDLKELQRSISEARKHCNPRAIVVINPGNPTGQVLTRRNVEEIVKFAQSERLLIMADEVYQDNVYTQGSEFHSFKKVLTEMGPPYNSVELASFMSTSKGYMGECGLRGGYLEFVNLLPEVKAMFLKVVSAKDCPTSIGQAVTDCIVKPPVDGEPSYELFAREKKEVLTSLAQRAKMVADAFNAIDGITCNQVQGAMYAFPRLHLPARAIAKAKEANQSPDSFYAFALLERTGICIVPGSGFGQLPGTYHFRTTILPQPEKLKVMMEKFRTFHGEFLAEYK